MIGSKSRQRLLALERPFAGLRDWRDLLEIVSATFHCLRFLSNHFIRANFHCLIFQGGS